MEWLEEKDYYALIIKGYKCAIKRNHSAGHLNGYITVSPNHVLLKEDLQWSSALEVHGGITYQNGNTIGFDCGHSMDYSPLSSYNDSDAVYRNVEFVINELNSLAEQLYVDETLNNKIKLKLIMVKEHFKQWLEQFFV